MNLTTLGKIGTRNIVDMFKTIVMFCVLLGFGSILSIANPTAINLLNLLMAVGLIAVNKSYFVNNKLFKVVVAVVVVGLIHMIITGSPISGYMGLFFRTIAILLLITGFKNDYYDIATHLIKAIKIIVILAFINYILVISAPDLFTTVELAEGYRIRSIGYIFNYLSTSEIAGFIIPRNQGVFWEPGVLQIPINIYIYYLLFEQNRSVKGAMLPIFILLTTVSTTGLIILGIQLIFKFKAIFSLKGRGLLMTMGMIIAIGVFIPLLHLEINRKFNNADEKKNVSSLARTFDMLMALKIVSQHPILGIGVNPDRQEDVMKHQDIRLDGLDDMERGNTNSILQLFVNFGVPLSLILIIGLYRQNLFKYKKVFFCIMLLSFGSEPLGGTFLMILLILSSVKLPNLMIIKK